MATELTKGYEHYLDRIARGEVTTTKFDQPALEQLAEYVAHTECRDLFFDRTPNKLEGQAWGNHRQPSRQRARTSKRVVPGSIPHHRAQNHPALHRNGPARRA
ncbi:TPA: hypothetical protein JAK05_002234 [Corynebacterium striatum]|nr:hypothetical protein [Corynebacterium striatum]HAT6564312.1 hypothetical protein [Corynebacterium striatum]HAT6569774.1 hypothetical protein [Corynebacterium striatum]